LHEFQGRSCGRGCEGLNCKFMSGAYHMFHRPPRFFTGFHKIAGLSKELYEWRGGGREKASLKSKA
jgi:hypothetical protein